MTRHAGTSRCDCGLSERWFDLNGASLLITSEDDALVAPLLRYLEELEAFPKPPANFVLDLARAPQRLPPEDADIICVEALPEGLKCTLANSGNKRWLYVPDHLTFEFSVDRKFGSLSVRPGSEWLLAGTPGIVAIEYALYAVQQFLMHAAALRSPDQESAFVLCGRSGAGKTTTALALAFSGFAFLTDDATVFVPPRQAGDGRFRIWGLPRALKVHRRTAELMPRVATLLGSDWNAEGEQVLCRQSLKQVADVRAPRSMPLGAIILLGPRVDGEHVFRNADKAELMAYIASDNVRRGPSGMLPDQLQRFQVLAEAVSVTPAFELSVGTDLSSLGSSLSQFLARLSHRG